MAELPGTTREAATAVAGEGQVRQLRQLLAVLEKTLKTMRLYQSGNEVSRRLQGELADSLGQMLDEHGEMTLLVAEEALVLGDQVVYRAAERTDSLSFLFYRDGIRSLRFLPGIDERELSSFMDALVRMSVRAHQSDDLVTLLWERDLSHIKYTAVDELAEERHGPTIEQQLAHGGLAGEAASQAPAEAVSLADVSRPVARMPVRECVLSEEEVAELQREIAAEEAAEPLLMMVDLGVELSLLGGTEEELIKIRDALVTALDAAVDGTHPQLFTAAVARLVELAEELSAQHGAAAELVRATVQQLASPASVERFLAVVGRDPGALTSDELKSYLARLGARALPTVVEQLGALPAANVRRSVAEAVVAAGVDGAAAVEEHVARAATVTGPQLTELLFVVRRLPEAASLVVIRGLLHRTEGELRRQAALSLGPYQDGAVGELWVELLLDEDPEMRGLAITALVRGARPELAQPLVDATMGEAFASYSGDEKQRWFAAIARLSGPPSAQWLAEILWRPRRSHFLPREEKETVSAVVHAIACLPPATARSAFVKLIDSGDRHVRAACRKALKELES